MTENKSEIIFLSVGNGDSIVIDTVVGGIHHIGIIDCRERNGICPTAVFLDKIPNEQLQIDFVLVSHPHEDHCDGIEKLLHYIEDRKLVVKAFYYTYWYRDAIEMENARNRLPSSQASLFSRLTVLINNYHTKGIITNRHEASGGNSLAKYDALGIFCFSPELHEKNFFFEALPRVAFFENGSWNIEKAARFSNLHSSVFLVVNTNSKKSILLTSDAEKTTFRRLLQTKTPDLYERIHKWPLVAVQIPHHGSKKNFFKKFWDGLTLHPFHAVISAGHNNKYGHPDEDVLSYLLNDCRVSKICLTDKFLAHYLNEKKAGKKSRRISNNLDFISGPCDKTGNVIFSL